MVRYNSNISLMIQYSNDIFNDIACLPDLVNFRHKVFQKMP